ncbi:hypothetical protein VTO58DRAFT_110190 [Aureobasidium pullulans]|nr:hypothetical protein JADG_001067 [Aureobasidium pullulans]
MSAEIRNLESLSALAVERHVSTTPSGSTVTSYAKDLGEGPVLWLVHGYPQSAYIWRHLIPQLQNKISLFVPELPGYGVSSRPKKDGFAAVGQALLEASHELFPNRPIILGGHDRGARICHRLAVTHAHPPQDETANLHSYKLLGTIMLDIVPTLVQWQAFARPTAAASYFHWPFLASPIAPDMIEAYGGDRWTHDALNRISTDDSEGLKAMQSDDAWKVYETLHAKRETIEGSCADYAAGCYVEPPLQEEDQREGRKLECPALIMWSMRNLGKTHGDVEAIWKQWFKDESLLTAQGVGDDAGHYLPEEANKFVGKAMNDFLNKVMK